MEPVSCTRSLLVDATWAMVDDYQFLGEIEMF
jgi:hypothetical protein